MTYLEWYLAGLYEQLELGGAQEDVDRLVNEINKPTVEGLEWFMQLRKHANPQYGFMGLIGGCSSCGAEFAIPNPTPKLEQEFLCPSCVPPPPPTITTQPSNPET